MNRESILWLIVMLIGAAMLAGRAMLSENGMGKAYVKPIEETYVELDADAAETLKAEAKAEDVDAADTEAGDIEPPADASDETAAGAGADAEAEKEPERVWVSVNALPESFDTASMPSEDVRSWDTYEKKNFKDYVADQSAGTNDVVFSLSHSIGIWVAALLTLFILSFLIKDNPLYKIAESMFIGISAAYWMVVGFWDTIVPNLFAKLAPVPTTEWALPGLRGEAEFEALYIIPLIFGVLLLMRLSPKGGWLSRWPMAFFIGTFCGYRLITFLHADFLSQIRNTIVSLYAVSDTGFDFWESVRNLILVIGVLACIVYFFFSFEHKGVVGGTARLGIWFLMVTFGAAFAYTVMGRIALLAIRIEFLFDDWLWLIDPTGRRAVEAAETAGALLYMPMGVFM